MLPSKTRLWHCVGPTVTQLAIQVVDAPVEGGIRPAVVEHRLVQRQFPQLALQYEFLNFCCLRHLAGQTGNATIAAHLLKTVQALRWLRK